MGQIQSMNGLRLQVDVKRRERRKSLNASDLEFLGKSVKILIGDESVILTYSPGTTTTGSLISQLSKTSKNPSKVVAFKTLDGIEILDYMLSLTKVKVKHLKDAETLIGVLSEEVDFEESLKSFCPIKVVGKGGYSVVTMVRKKDTGCLYAIKSIKKSYVIQQRRVDHVLSERKILASLNHPFIIQLQSSFQTVDHLHLVLEFCPGGELFYHLHNIGRFTEDQARFYFAEIVLAMECLHSNGIIYRDLKPENILLDFDGHIKLTDFGTSRESKKEEVRYTYCGSAEYMSPEMISKSGHGLSMDCFSLGSLLYEMLTGSPPFYDPDTEKMFWKIQNEPLHLPKYFSQDVKSLLQGLLSKDPTIRLGSEFISDIKDHPWCSSIHWQKLYKKKVAPPFRPNMRVSNFDPEFTCIPIDNDLFNEARYKPSIDDKFYDFDYEKAETTTKEFWEVFADTDEQLDTYLPSVGSSDRLSPDVSRDDSSWIISKSPSFKGVSSPKSSVKSSEAMMKPPRLPHKTVVSKKPPLVNTELVRSNSNRELESEPDLAMINFPQGMSRMKIHLKQKFSNRFG